MICYAVLLYLYKSNIFLGQTSVSFGLNLYCRADMEPHEECHYEEGEDDEDQRVIWANAIKGIGQRFKNHEQFRKVVKNHCIAVRRGFIYVHNNKRRIYVKCSVEDCGWRIYASRHKSDDSFAIRTCALTHGCGVNNLQSREHPNANATWVATFIKEKVRRDPNYTANMAVDEIQAAFKVDISYRTAWSAREIAMKELHGADMSPLIRSGYFAIG